MPNVAPHHGVGAPLRDEGVGLILRDHSFNQGHSVADALPHFHKGRVSPSSRPETRRLCNAYGCQTNNSN